MFLLETGTSLTGPNSTSMAEPLTTHTSLPPALTSLWRLLRRTEVRLLLPLLGVLAMIWGFLALTDEVRDLIENGTQHSAPVTVVNARLGHDLTSHIGIELEVLNVLNTTYNDAEY